MAMTKKHVGFGRWVVLDEGRQVAGPMTKAEAEATVLTTPKAKVNPVVAEREYWRWVNECLGKPVAEDMAKLRAIIADSTNKYTDIEQAGILRQFEAILKARGQSIRRSHNTVLPAKAA